jgi:hypothetical protein
MRKDVTGNSGTTVCSSRAFQVGDCIILNDAEQPCGRMVCVITGNANDLGFYSVQYLNADRSFDSYCEPPMANRLLRATKLEDFGVVLRTDGTRYWCEKVSQSKATYPDGNMRVWQEPSGPIKFTIRSSVLPYLGAD